MNAYKLGFLVGLDQLEKAAGIGGALRRASGVVKKVSRSPEQVARTKALRREARGQPKMTHEEFQKKQRAHTPRTWPEYMIKRRSR